MLSTIAAPAIGVVPRAFETMRQDQGFVVGAALQNAILLMADTSIGQALIALCAGSARDRRIGTAPGTAHDKLQVAVAYLGHGWFPP